MRKAILLVLVCVVVVMLAAPCWAMVDPQSIEWEFYGPLWYLVNGIWMLVL